jgi:hypothetical protein
MAAIRILIADNHAAGFDGDFATPIDVDAFIPLLERHRLHGARGRDGD